jgi:hypothetical protein
MVLVAQPGWCSSSAPCNRSRDIIASVFYQRLGRHYIFQDIELRGGDKLLQGYTDLLCFPSLTRRPLRSYLVIRAVIHCLHLGRVNSRHFSRILVRMIRILEASSFPDSKSNLCPSVESIGVIWPQVEVHIQSRWKEI